MMDTLKAILMVLSVMTKDKQCHKIPKSQKHKECKKIVDTTYIEECEEIVHT